MSENQKFKLKYDKLREGDPTKRPDATPSSNSEAEDKSHSSTGNVRNLCFAWPDGRKQFLNYAYLVSGELNVTDETNSIILSFTSHTVTLKGYNLEELFSALFKQSPSLISQTDTRYASAKDEKDYTVIEISVSPAS